MDKIFYVYDEPIFFSYLITIFSCLNYFLIIATALYIFRLAYYAKYQSIMTHRSIIFISSILTLVNYNYHLYLNIWPLTAVYLALAYISYKWIKSKSLKWINLSMALFIIFICLTYNLFNTLIHRITYPFFSFNDILEYTFTFKPYFEAYNTKYNSLLGQIKFIADGQTFDITNYPLEFRVYTFYYVLNALGVFIWLYIYFDILKKHNLYFNKDKKDQPGNFFFIKPSKINPVLQEPGYIKNRKNNENSP